MSSARKFWAEFKEPYKAKKKLIFALRESVLGIQLVRHDRLVDFSEGNEYHRDLFENTVISDWDSLRNWFHPRYELQLTLFRVSGI